MGITTKDLAQICGVSRTTIHRALHGGGRIHPDTKEKILQAAKEHDYRPDLLARGLVKGRTYCIGVVVMDVNNRYFAEMLSAISQEANKQGYHVNITLHGEDCEVEREQLTRLAAYRMDGIILSSVNEGEEYKKFLQSLETPIVSVDNRIAEGIPFVSIDQKAAMAEAADRVLERDYERIVFVCPGMDVKKEQNLYVHKERLKGFEETLRTAPAVKTEKLLDGDYLERAEALLQDGKRTAFLCSADEFALNIMKHLREKGKKPARDYGIVGFDHIDTLKYVEPRLVTISNSVNEVAATAVNLLFQLIEQNQNGEETDTKEKNAEVQQDRYKILPYGFVEGETI